MLGNKVPSSLPIAVLVLLGAYAAVSQTLSIVHQSPMTLPIDTSGYRLTQVYSNDFHRAQKMAFERNLIKQDTDGKWRRVATPEKGAEWIVEGNGGVDIRDGRLRASPLPFDKNGKQISGQARSHLVIWNKHIFPADFLAEFDMSPSGSSNGLTIVFICATGKNGEDMFDQSLPPRLADYKNYHSAAIANYSDAYWSRNTKEESETNRLRKNAGFTLVAEGDSLTTGPTDVTHRVRVLKVGGHIEVEINGRIVLRWDDAAKPLGAGRIGFRSMEGVSMITYDNFKVWKVVRK